MSGRLFRQSLLGMVLASSLILVACGSRINSGNFNRIQNGMSEQEVIAILGEPSTSDSVGIGPLSGTTSTWTHEGLTISVQFLNGKVALKNLTKES
jgi:hypothetical protein